MQKKILVILTLCAFLLSCMACGKTGTSETDNSEKNGAEESAKEQTSEESSDIESEEKELAGYVNIDDGDFYEYPVKAFGEEFALPESKNGESLGEFIGWIVNGDLLQPGDIVIAQEFMIISAVYSDSQMGTVVILDPSTQGYSTMASEGEMELFSPYENPITCDSEEFFDHWVDADGNVYEIGESVTVDAGQVLILHAVYSKDYTEAYKVDIYYNNGVEFFDQEYHIYVKKGVSIPLWILDRPAGYTFDGWFDDPETGHFLNSGEEDGELYTPTCDISLYGHWTEE